MSLELAKSRRLAALENRKSDRLLVAPVENKSDLQLPEPETPAADMIDALKKGVTVEELSAQMEWPKAQLMANLYRVAKKTGIGVERRDAQLHIVWPETAHGSADDEDSVVDMARYVRAA